MPDIRIKKFDTHFRLPQSLWRERRRLEQVRTAVLEEAMELALERVGLPEDGELVIRRIVAPIRLRLIHSDVELAMQWSLALANEIETALRSRQVANVVFYRTRREALLELVIHSARGDFSRAWAWRQLGLWHASEQPDKTETIQSIVRALACEPTIVIPALQALLDAGLLLRVMQRMHDEHWDELAHAVMNSMLVTADFIATTPTPHAVRDAMRVLKSSRLLLVLQASLSIQSESVLRAIATIAVMEVEPAFLRTNAAPTLIELVASAIQNARAEKQREAIETWPEEVVIQSEKDEPLDLRQRAMTRFGGLLYVLNVIEDLQLQNEILAQLGERGLRWAMHKIAQTLLPVLPDDPAALAFAGLRPNESSPDDEQKPCTKNEAHVIHTFANRILARLRTLLNWRENDTLLLAFICERHAEIVADPGWIEVRFSLDAVATEVRRAGLDLDPGYVTWLGLVVKFVYA